MEKIIIIGSELFKNFPGLIFGFSTKPGGVSKPPLNLNLSYSVGDIDENVKANRRLFFNELNIKEAQITFQKQIHSSNIFYVSNPGLIEGCDAIYTDRKKNILAVSTADCIPVFLYSPEKKVIAGIHAGWKGTHSKIVIKTIERLKSEFAVECKSLMAFIGPGICREHYEVGFEVAELFDEEVKIKYGNKFKLDLKKENLNQLISSGINNANIEVSGLCTYCEEKLFHSYRRDGDKAGRMLGIIGMI